MKRSGSIFAAVFMWMMLMFCIYAWPMLRKLMQ